MKYILTSLLCIFFLNVNFAQSGVQTTRAERSQLGQMEQAKRSATKAFMVSLDRYREAIKDSDKESQADIKRDLLMCITKVISTNKYVLKEAPLSDANETKVAETKSMISQQKTLLKKAGNSDDAQEIEKIMVEFMETLKK
jgi:hypothetical protein